MKKKSVLGVNLHKVLKNHSINESALGSVPDFKIDEAVDDCLQRIASHIKSHILRDKSKDPIQRNEAINNASIVIKELKDEMKEMIKEKLFIYSRG